MSANHIVEIRLSDVGGPVFTGRQKGIAVRKKYKLDDLDSESSHVKIFIPEDTFSVSSSFLLGFLGESIRNLGSRDDFYSVFEIDGPSRFLRTVDSCIDRALATRTSIVESPEKKN